MGGRHLSNPIYHTRGRAQTIAVLFLGQAPLRCVIGNGTALTTAEARIQPTSGRNALARTSTALARAERLIFTPLGGSVLPPVQAVALPRLFQQQACKRVDSGKAPAPGRGRTSGARSSGRHTPFRTLVTSFCVSRGLTERIQAQRTTDSEPRLLARYTLTPARTARAVSRRRSKTKIFAIPVGSELMKAVPASLNRIERYFSWRIDLALIAKARQFVASSGAAPYQLSRVGTKSQFRR